MSQENVDAVRRFLGNALTDPDLVWDVYADDVVWDLTGIPAAPDFPRISHGPDAVREFFRRWAGAFDEWHYEVGDIIDGPNAVVAQIHQSGKGKGSGVPVDSHFWQVWHMRDGTAFRVTHTGDRKVALEAAGLSE